MTQEFIQNMAVQGLNISLMLSLGLELQRSQLRAAAKQTRLLVLTALFNLGLIPFLAFGAIQFMSVAGAVSAGILLSAFAPGGGTGTLLTRLAGGNLALSVIALALLTLLAVPITPILTTLCLGSTAEDSLRPAALLKTLLVYQFVPFVIGALMREKSERSAKRVNALARPLSNLIFALLVIGLLITQGHLALQVGWRGICIIVVLVVASLVIPLGVKMPTSDKAAVSLTSAVRNLSLALLLSSTFFSQMTTITVLTYGLIMYLIGVPCALLFRKKTLLVPSSA